MPSRLTTEIFIGRANKTHNNKFDYSKSIYIHSQKDIIITCKEHGDFIQTPESHLRYGCTFCSGKRLTTDAFIIKAKKIHGDKYDYSKSVYKSYEEKIIITCPIHGDFLKKTNHHLSGDGCSKCCRNQRLTQEVFLQRANQIHNKIYNYEYFIFVNNMTKGEIECSKHGLFKMSPDRHLRLKMACPICTKEKVSKRNRKSIDIFIKEAKTAHGNKYDYSLVD